MTIVMMVMVTMMMAVVMMFMMTGPDCCLDGVMNNSGRKARPRLRQCCPEIILQQSLRLLVGLLPSLLLMLPSQGGLVCGVRRGPCAVVPARAPSLVILFNRILRPCAHRHGHFTYLQLGETQRHCVIPPWISPRHSNGGDFR